LVRSGSFSYGVEFDKVEKVSYAYRGGKGMASCYVIKGVEYGLYVCSTKEKAEKAKEFLKWQLTHGGCYDDRVFIKEVEVDEEIPEMKR